VKAYFGRRYSLSASHRLNSDALTPEQNRSAYGKCNNPHGHGHNYTVEVLVGGPVGEDTGMVVNLVDLDAMVRTRVIDRFDHTDLNLDPLFTSAVPTTENLCRVVFRLLKGNLHAAGLGDAAAGTSGPHWNLEYVRVEETENNFFQCFDSDPQVSIA
jgi:6-pyruvoyltetrahydropterin/6-carboxytetrahydropterin synthase